MSDPTPFSTPNEILMDIHGRMVRLETKFENHATLESRVSKLEGAYRILVAAGAVCVFVLTFFQDVLTSAFRT